MKRQRYSVEHSVAVLKQAKVRHACGRPDWFPHGPGGSIIEGIR